jgi:Na+/melibiose symporter-like transporter
VTAFGFLVATLYLALAKSFEEPVAALLTSLVLVGVAGLILLIVRYRRSRRRTARAVEANALLLSITDQVRRDPWRALAVAAVLGALAEIARPSSDRPPG